MELVIGVDFGSDSVRAVAVDASNGIIQAESVSLYPRWQGRLFCDIPRQVFRHHPEDYLDAMTDTIRRLISALSVPSRQCVKAIGIDATGSTVCPVNAEGIPLALLPEFHNDPGAMFHLWKDHSADQEAAEINDVFSKGKYNYLQYQGTYSAEWFWAKMLHTIRESPDIRKQSVTWVELADWIPNVLSGINVPKKMYRCACAAGHKALWNANFGGLPDRECLSKLHPYLARTVDHYRTPGASTALVGRMSSDWCSRLGLPEGVIISGSSLDAHAGAVGAGIRPGTLVKVIGTSTVDMAVAKGSEIEGKNLQGVCGCAENSVLPGFWGLEAGQAAFGDVFAWFEELLSWPIKHCDTLTEEQKAKITEGLIIRLQQNIDINDIKQDVIMLDWFNGRRYPSNDDRIRASAMGLSLGMDAPAMMRAIILAVVMGSRAIFDAMARSGISFERVIAVGGIAQKSPVIMQTMADVLNRSVLVNNTQQACALGSSMYAAVAAGIYETLNQAQLHMNPSTSTEYTPDRERHFAFEKTYDEYQRLAAITNRWYQKG